MLWVIAILILLIFAPYLLALLGVAAIPIIIITGIGILYMASSIFLKAGKVNRLEKKFIAEEEAKYKEIKKEYVDKTVRDLKKIEDEELKKYNDFRLPYVQYQFESIEYAEKKHERNMKHWVFVRACRELIDKKNLEEIININEDKTIKEIKKMKEKEIKDYQEFVDKENYSSYHVTSSEKEKRKKLNEIRLKAYDALIYDKKHNINEKNTPDIKSEIRNSNDSNFLKETKKVKETESNDKINEKKTEKTKSPKKSKEDFNNVRDYEKYRIYCLIEEILLNEKIPMSDGESFGFTKNTIVVHLNNSDAQIRLTTPKAGLERYEELDLDYVEVKSYDREEKSKVEDFKHISVILRSEISKHIEIYEGCLFGFTSTTFNIRAEYCDVQLKLVFPRDGVLRYEKVANYIGN